jgi:hypothetical protein
MAENKVQAIIFNKQAWTPEQAEEYLHYREIYPIKPVHETKNYLRYRLARPCRICKYRTKEIHPGIKVIIMRD